MGFENTTGGCFNTKGVSQVNAGYKTIVYNSQGGNEYIEVKQVPDTQGVYGCTKYHTAVVRGSANEAILAAKNTIARSPGAVVQVVDAATGNVTVYNKNNVNMSVYETLKARNTATRGRKPSVVEQVKAQDAVLVEAAPVEAYVSAIMMDPTTIEGGYRVTAGFDKAGRATLHQNGNFYAKKTGTQLTGVVAHKFASKSAMLKAIEAERVAGTPRYKAEDVPSAY